ncbi:hypothetical protein [Azospirillum sp.]|uniref:hypothetical protein n=1 Tax=Azospirillum sp. TaxID=34012 RepID=UPI002D351009|nr:hypothetical protein [Azospirillum sp.]HYD66734.1 hypothetical protein [Azospirillum sp.]
MTNKSNFVLEANVITRRPNISRSTGIYVPVNQHYCVDLYPTETADKVWIRPIPGSETPYPVGQPNWQGIYNAVVTGTALSYKVEWR